MKTRLVIGMIAMFIALHQPCNGQTDTVQTDIPYLSMGQPLGLLSGHGYSNSATPSGLIALAANPASITRITQPEISVSYQASTSAKYDPFGRCSYSSSFPQSLSFVLPIKNFVFGLGAQQNYNYKLVLNPIPITTAEHPDGTGEYYSAIFKTQVLNIGAILAFAVDGLLCSRDRLSIGVQINTNLYFHSEKILAASVDFNSSQTGYGLGLTYGYRLMKNEAIQFGLSYRPAYTFTSVAKLDKPDYEIPNFPAPKYAKGKLQLPAELRLGLSYELNAKTIFFCDYTMLSFDSFTNGDAEIIEKQFSYGLKFPISTRCELSLATLSKSPCTSVLVGNQWIFFTKMNYLMAGLTIATKNIAFDIALADTHLLPDNNLKYTLGKVGLSIFL